MARKFRWMEVSFKPLRVMATMCIVHKRIADKCNVQGMYDINHQVLLHGLLQ